MFDCYKHERVDVTERHLYWSRKREACSFSTSEVRAPVENMAHVASKKTLIHPIKAFPQSVSASVIVDYSISEDGSFFVSCSFSLFSFPFACLFKFTRRTDGEKQPDRGEMNERRNRKAGELWRDGGGGGRWCRQEDKDIRWEKKRNE